MFTAGLTLAIALGCSRPAREDGTAPPVAFGPGDALTYADVRELVDASDAVVVARVVGTSVGRTVVSHVFRIVELEVEEVLAGEVPDPRILVEEEAFVLEPDRVVTVTPSHRSHGTEIGETWIAALDLKEGLDAYGRPTYGVLGSAGFFLVKGDGVETRSSVVDLNGRPLASLSLEELKDAFRRPSDERTTP